jgi:hypothetical protein
MSRATRKPAPDPPKTRESVGALFDVSFGCRWISQRESCSHTRPTR